MKKFKEFTESCDLFDQNTDGTKEFIKAHGKADTPLTGKLAADGQFKSSKAKAKNGGYEGEADEEAYEKANPKTKKSSKKDDDDDYNRINNYQYESEQLDELSKDTISSYLKKNAEERRSGKEDPKKSQKRFEGSLKASKRFSNAPFTRGLMTSKPINPNPPTMREEALKLIAEKIIYAAVAEEYFSDDDLELLMLDLEELLSLEGIK